MPEVLVAAHIDRMGGTLDKDPRRNHAAALHRAPETLGRHEIRPRSARSIVTIPL